jgi:hypothetical protein
MRRVSSLSTLLLLCIMMPMFASAQSFIQVRGKLTSIYVGGTPTGAYAVWGINSAQNIFYFDGEAFRQPSWSASSCSPSKGIAGARSGRASLQTSLIAAKRTRRSHAMGPAPRVSWRTPEISPVSTLAAAAALGSGKAGPISTGTIAPPCNTHGYLSQTSASCQLGC